MNLPISETVRVERAPDHVAVAAFCVDAPAAPTVSETYTLPISGWVIGRNQPVKEIEVSFDGHALRRVPVDLERPDVAEAHGPGGQRSGFAASVGLATLPPDATLQLFAVLEDDSRAPLAAIVCRRRRLDCGYEPAFQPMIVTSLFRMGTTRLMRLLSEHPDVVVERTYPYETCVASYWLHAAKILSEPANLHESSHPNDFVEKRRWIGHNPFNRAPISTPARVSDWMGRASVEQAIDFGRRMTDGFYAAVCEDQGEGRPRYFAEKHLPDSHVPDMLHELYPETGEIVLVRDFRDVICSMIAFNKKRGFPSFGRQKVDTDKQMIELFAGRCAELLRAWTRRRATARLVRYEDLIHDPAGTLATALGPTGLDNSNPVISSLIERADRDTPELAFHRTTRSPAQSIGRWKNDLEPANLDLAEQLLREPLAAFGYEPAGVTA